MKKQLSNNFQPKNESKRELYRRALACSLACPAYREHGATCGDLALPFYRVYPSNQVRYKYVRSRRWRGKRFDMSTSIIWLGRWGAPCVFVYFVYFALGPMRMRYVDAFTFYMTHRERIYALILRSISRRSRKRKGKTKNNHLLQPFLCADSTN